MNWHLSLHELEQRTKQSGSSFCALVFNTCNVPLLKIAETWIWIVWSPYARRRIMNAFIICTVCTVRTCLLQNVCCLLNGTAEHVYFFCLMFFSGNIAPLSTIIRRWNRMEYLADISALFTVIGADLSETRAALIIYWRNIWIPKGDRANSRNPRYRRPKLFILYIEIGFRSAPYAINDSGDPPKPHLSGLGLRNGRTCSLLRTGVASPRKRSESKRKQKEKIKKSGLRLRRYRYGAEGAVPGLRMGPIPAYAACISRPS